MSEFIEIKSYIEKINSKARESIKRKKNNIEFKKYLKEIGVDKIGFERSDKREKERAYGKGYKTRGGSRFSFNWGF